MGDLLTGEVIRMLRWIRDCRQQPNYINSRRYREALNTLDQVPERSALWYYLSGCANAGIGNNILAPGSRGTGCEYGTKQYAVQTASESVGFQQPEDIRAVPMAGATVRAVLPAEPEICAVIL